MPTKAPMHGPVRTALEETIASDARLSTKRHAALVALCRLLAGQIDDAGGEANNRLTAAYLSALKDIDRALGDKQPIPTGGAGSSGALGKLQGLKGGKSA